MNKINKSVALAIAAVMVVGVLGTATFAEAKGGGGRGGGGRASSASRPSSGSTKVTARMASKLIVDDNAFTHEEQQEIRLGVKRIEKLLKKDGR